MYISRIEASLPRGQHDEVKTRLASDLESLRTMDGFRWALLLSAIDDADKLAVVSMWLSADQAKAQPGNALSDKEERKGYDVTTARGSMTPATHAAIVDWQVSDDISARFTNRWNAMYHAIEDRIGSRLLKDLESPGAQTGLHVMTDASHLNPEMFGSSLTDAEGLSVAAVGVRCYEVLLLTEA